MKKIDINFQVDFTKSQHIFGKIRDYIHLQKQDNDFTVNCKFIYNFDNGYCSIIIDKNRSIMAKIVDIILFWNFHENDKINLSIISE